LLFSASLQVELQKIILRKIIVDGTLLANVARMIADQDVPFSIASDATTINAGGLPRSPAGVACGK
jgi:hypothetical protein